MGEAYLTRRGGGSSASIPKISYTGECYLLVGNSKDWEIRCLTSGVLTFDRSGNAKKGVDVFCVGGGGGGSTGNQYHGGAGGGGGYTTSVTNAFSVVDDDTLTITIGSGGATATDGGDTSITDGTATVSALGGKKGNGSGDGVKQGGAGGSGGGGSSRYGTGGTGGSNGSSGSTATGSSQNGTGGAGQLRTTRAFGESSRELFSGGGAGGSGADKTTYGVGGEGGGGGSGQVRSATPNTGGGGGGGSANPSAYRTGGAGGSGIVLIRNTSFTERLYWDGENNGGFVQGYYDGNNYGDTSTYTSGTVTFGADGISCSFPASSTYYSCIVISPKMFNFSGYSTLHVLLNTTSRPTETMWSGLGVTSTSLHYGADTRLAFQAYTGEDLTLGELEMVCDISSLTSFGYPVVYFNKTTTAVALDTTISRIWLEE